MKYTLPKLSYDYDALEPFIDAQTMEIHHTKHHQAYIDKLNGVLEKYPAFADTPLADLMKTLNTLDMGDDDKKLLQNHGGGHLNHAFFWTIMAPKKELDSALSNRIEKTYGGIDQFKELFSSVATSVFGSGWAWLVEDENKNLKVYSTPNQNSPYLNGHTPLVGLDLWEHAYYLKYHNRRPEYLTNWWNVLKLL